MLMVSIVPSSAAVLGQAAHNSNHLQWSYWSARNHISDLRGVREFGQLYDFSILERK
jgi:hypothetical protein